MRMSKYSIPDGHWDADKAASVDGNSSRAVEVKTHTIRILQRRDAGPDWQWTVAVRDGTIFAVARGHRLAESNQFDPMGATWADVPTIVRVRLAAELNVDVEALDSYVDSDAPGIDRP